MLPKETVAVLVVDDEPVFRRGLERLLTDHGYEAVLAENGERALALMKQRRFDLILCDFRLPDIDGLGILVHLKQSGCTTPFLLLTAYYSELFAQSAISLGAAAVFEKPVRLEDLLRNCEIALGRRGAVRNRAGS